MLQTTPLALGFLLEIKRQRQQQYTWDMNDLQFLGVCWEQLFLLSFSGRLRESRRGLHRHHLSKISPIPQIPNRARSHGCKSAPKMVVVGHHRHHHSEAELSLLRKSGVSIPHHPQHPSGPRGFSCVRLIPVPHERAGPVKDAQSGAGSALQGCRLNLVVFRELDHSHRPYFQRRWKDDGS